MTQMDRIIAVDREESDCCDRLTPGCSINHDAERRRDGWLAAENGSCEPW